MADAAALLSVDEALRRILAEARPLPAREASLREALGAVLAEEVASDVDHPPFDRSMMDGYAVRAGDPGPWEAVEEIHAGRVPGLPWRPGACAKIMTGAPLPAGADAVQQVERTRVEGGRVVFEAPVVAGQNVAPRGSEARAGQTLLRRGQRLRAAEIGILAAAGRTRVRIVTRPRVAVASTGDELVPPDERPGPGRIRNSNGFAIAAQVRELGLECDDLGIVRDDPEAIRAAVREGLKRDVLLLSGGVSAGDRDLVVPALEAEGVRLALHKVAIKPGKPFCFAPRVFGLPGNPVSSFVIFEVFVRPYLGGLAGTDLARRRVRAALAGPSGRPQDRTRFVPARLREGGASVALLPWQSSADLFALADANALVVLPAGAAPAAGEAVDCLVLD
jgi:molybdopterin molybdotransferase